jgi:hypothetical protein
MTVRPASILRLRRAFALIAFGSVAGLCGCGARGRGETFAVAAQRPPLPKAPEILPEDASSEEVPWLRPLPASMVAALHAPGCPDCAEAMKNLSGKRPKTPIIPGEPYR